MISNIKYQYLLLFIAIIWVFFFSFSIQLQPYFDFLGDDISYLESSKLLYFKTTLSETRPLLISLIFGFPYLFGFSTSVVLKWGFCLNFLCWLSTIILIFKIVESQFNRQRAFISGVVFILCIGNLAHAFRFLSESLFIFFLVLSIYFINKYFLTKKISFVIFGIFILGLISLVKPIAIGVFLIVLFFFIKKIKFLIFNKHSILLVFVLGLLVFQMYLLKKTYGDFTLSYISSYTYYNYLGAKADCYKKNIKYIPGKNARTYEFNKLSSSKKKEIADNDFLNQIKHKKLNLLKAYIFCIYSNSSKGNYIVNKCENLNDTSYFSFFKFIFKSISKLQNIVFTLVGVFLSFYFILNLKKENLFYVLISLILLYIFFVSAMSCYECDRFNIIFFPIVILLCNHYFKLKIILK